MNNFTPLFQEGQQNDNNQLCTQDSEIQIQHQHGSAIIPLQNVTELAKPVIIPQSTADAQKNVAEAHSMSQKSRHPVLIICPKCKHKGYTATQHDVGSGGQIVACILCCCCTMFCWVPFYDEDCQDVKHYCRFCKQLIDVCEFVVCQTL